MGDVNKRVFIMLMNREQYRESGRIKVLYKGVKKGQKYGRFSIVKEEEDENLWSYGQIKKFLI